MAELWLRVDRAGLNPFTLWLPFLHRVVLSGHFVGWRLLEKRTSARVIEATFEQRLNVTRRSKLRDVPW
jgi:hypothetical protein